MKFEEALAVMREGKKVRRKDTKYVLMVFQGKIFRCYEIRSDTKNIVSYNWREDWEIVND